MIDPFVRLNTEAVSPAPSQADDSYAGWLRTKLGTPAGQPVVKALGMTPRDIAGITYDDDAETFTIPMGALDRSNAETRISGAKSLLRLIIEDTSDLDNLKVRFVPSSGPGFTREIE